MGDSKINALIKELENIYKDEITKTKSGGARNATRISRSRDTSTQRKENSRSKSVVNEDRTLQKVQSGGSSAEKIMNVEADNDSKAFLDICDAFEKFLTEFDLNENEAICDKLIEIKNLIEGKIWGVCGGKSELGNLSRSSSLASIPQNFELKCEASFKKFLKAVACPFCLSVEDDKTSLIRHIDENCVPHLTNKFRSEGPFPFAEFQILPNNTFKCNICKNAVQNNIKHWYVHKYGKFHQESFRKLSKEKSYTEYLFCSCCKVLVHNYFTEIDFHVKHSIHKTKADNKKSSQFYLSQGIQCVYNNKKFKCLICPSGSAKCHSTKAILQHFETPVHFHMRKNPHSLPAVHCDICLERLDLFHIISHFNSDKHKTNEMKSAEKRFELCLYCGLVCDSIIDLSCHMKSGCQDIRKIRQSSKGSENAKKPDVEKADMANKVEKNESDIAPKSIIVKGHSEITELFKYFRKFGEITAVEPHNDKDVMIKFRERSAVTDVLLLRNVITINGVKLEVTEGNSSEPDEAVPETRKGSSDSDSSRRESDSDADPVEPDVPEDSLDELFQRVSYHLINNTNSKNSDQEKKIVSDCSQTVGAESCDLVGFSGSGLSFPFESINMFCSLNKYILNDSDSFTANLLKTSYQNLSSSQLWGDVTSCSEKGTFPYIKCLHKESQKACTITFSRSAMLLTTMLRDCIEKSDLVKHFCLIIRFWFSVHELKIRELEYTLISLMVFFLVNEQVVEFSLMFKEPEFLSKDFINYQKIRKGGKSTALTVKELFQKFLLFIGTFDFEKYAICLPSRNAVLKTIFTTAEFKLLSRIKNTESLINSCMCVLDPISFSNMAAEIQPQDKSTFLRVVKSTIKHYKIK